MEVMSLMNKELVIEQPRDSGGGETMNADIERFDDDVFPSRLDIPKLIDAVMNTQVVIKSHTDKIASPVSSQTSSSLGESTTSSDTLSEKPLRMDLGKEIDEDVIELELERVGEMIHTHTPYCPNCNSQITKVILRRKIKREEPTRSTAVEDSPRRDEPVDLFGCLSCFSFFVPSENALKRFRLFGGKPKSAQFVGGNQHTLVADLDAAPGASMNADGSTTMKQVSAFNLFWIFRRGRQGETAHAVDSKGKHTEESYIPTDVRYGASKPGDSPKITPTDQIGPSDQLVIDVQHGTENVVERGTDARDSTPVEIVKCIVYGGLLELITSMSVVSSAVASGATTLNIVAIGLATAISAIFIFGNNLVDLKNDTSTQNVDEQQTDRYQELLGKRGHFFLHATLAILSFLILGLLPPLVYAFAFYESDNRDYKILAVAVASFLCIIILATGQAYVRRTRKLSGYVKVVMYYVVSGITASGVAYAAGDLINLLMKRLDWFGAATPAVGGSATSAIAWVSY